jgi:pantoate--beta-alanine ligase
MILSSRLIFNRRLVSRYIHVANSIEEMRNFRRQNPVLSFVPTMGALHEGHLALVRQAKILGHKVVVSIFVNPKQFTEGEDLDKYPRQLEKDLELLKPLGVDCVFVPHQHDMYPGGKDSGLCYIEPAKFNKISEGVARPEFFRGVATVVCKLFNIVQPTTAFFGQKDIAQCILIKRMVTDLNIPVEITVCPTVREEDGLALSSRNAYLTETQRNVSGVLYKALSAGKEMCERAVPSDNSVGSSDGTLPLDYVRRQAIIDAITEVLKTEPQVSLVEYISVAAHSDMMEMDVYGRKALVTAVIPRTEGGADEAKFLPGAVISAAIRIGNVRLIDNVLVGHAETDILHA